MSHLLSNNLLTKYQFGLILKKSTCSHLLSSTFKWIKSLSLNKPTTVIYTDLSKAFDCVSHNKLIELLNAYRFTPVLTRWIKNFLTDRVQQVSIGSKLSDPLPVKSGVPQGSVIAPTMFNIFINDCTEPTHPIALDGGIRLFADDTKLFSTNLENLQNAMNNLCEWLKDRQLKLNTSKCYALKIFKRNCQSNSETTIDGTLVQSTAVIKDLGVMISENLKWGAQVDHVYKMASLTSYQILKAFKTKNIWIFQKLFTTYVRPKCEYNTPVWSPYYLQDIKKIERIQKRFTKRACIMCNIPFKDYNDRLVKLNLQSLQHRRIVFDLILIFKIINGLSDLQFDDFFTFRNNLYCLRGNPKTITTKYSSKSSVWHNCFFFAGCTILEFFAK